MREENLNQLRTLNKEIELIKKQIESLQPRITTDKVKGSYAEFPFTLHDIKISGIDESEYNRKLRRWERRLQLRLREVMELVEEMNEFLDTIENSEMRQILAMKYINGLSWREIATHLGYADESVPRKKCNRFLKMTDKSENQYDNMVSRKNVH